MRVEPIDRAKRFYRGTAQDVGFLKANVDTGMRQGRVVVRAKGIEPFRVDFRRSVAAQQPIFEKDAHFRHHRRAVGMARCGCPRGNWLPVTTTGLAKFSSIKLKAEAVKAMVSVPWSKTKPS